MTLSSDYLANAARIAAMVTASFTASEGAAEGALIGGLARRLMAETPAEALRVFTAWQGETVLGGLFFTRLRYPNDPRLVFMMAPVAVAPAHQGQGVGQQLIRHGLDQLRAEGVDIAVTYGDPAYYGRTGFRPVTVEMLPAPMPLQAPEGWLAQSLTETPLTPLAGPAHSVPVFDDPNFW